MNKKELDHLKDLVEKYHEVLINKTKYINVQDIDNEQKSEMECDEEDGEEELSDQDEEAEHEQDEIDDDQEYKEAYENVLKENAELKADQDKAKKLKRLNKGIKKSNEAQYEEDDQEDSESEEIEDDFKEYEEEEDEKNKAASQENKPMRSPSLGEINRSPSYRSIDSKTVKKEAIKYQGPDQAAKRRDSGASIRSRASNKRFADSVSEKSNQKVKRQMSMYRRDKLQGLESDYHQYLQKNQGIFVIRCQMMNIELQKIRETLDLEKMMVEFTNFKKLQKEIKQDEVYRGLQTIIIDIENTLVT